MEVCHIWKILKHLFFLLETVRSAEPQMKTKWKFAGVDPEEEEEGGNSGTPPLTLNFEAQLGFVCVTAAIRRQNLAPAPLLLHKSGSAPDLIW